MSTLQIINAKHPSSSTNNIVLDSAGNVSAAGTVVMSSSFKRNLIINGNFNIWQRGTSFSSSSVNEYSADRWRTEGNNVNSVISQQTFTVGQTAVPGYPTYYCRITTSSAPSVSWAFTQRIECPQNISGDGTYTISFWAKAVSGTIAAGTFNYGIITPSNNSPALTTTWQKITVTTTLSGVSQAAGYLTLYLVSITSAVSSLSVDVANIQIESGSTATPYEVQIYSDQLAQCQRYFAKTFNQTVAPAQNTGNRSGTIVIQCWTGASTSLEANWQLPVEMRAAPTITTYNPNNANSSWRNNASTGDVIVGTCRSGTRNCGLVVGAGIGATDQFFIHASANAEL